MAQQSITEQLLADIVSSTDTATSNLEARSKRTAQITREFSEIGKDIDEAVKIVDKRRQGERLRIMESKLETLRADGEQEERDLAAAVFGLNSHIEGMGKEYSELTKVNADEQALIDSAKQAVQDAEAKLATARTAWFFRGTKVRQAEAVINAAKVGITEAEVEAKKRQRNRLMSARMDASFQEIQTRSSRTIAIMKRRREDIKGQVVVVRAEKIRLQDDMKKAAEKVEQFDMLISQKETELRGAEEHLATLENGSDDHAAQLKLVSQFKSDLEELLGGRNTAVTKHQSSDKFAKELEVHEQAQVRLRDNLLMWITALEADTQARVVTFRSRLEAMKASADQEVARTLDDLGAEVDQRNVADMAAMGAASDRAREERFSKMPDRVRAIHEIAIAQVQARAAVEAKMEHHLAEWRAKYGIDPMSTSYFTQDGPAPSDI